MHRTISNYKITKRKDGRYYVRLQDGGEITHICEKTKAEIQAQPEIKLEELNALSRRRTEQAFPTENITLWKVKQPEKNPMQQYRQQHPAFVRRRGVCRSLYIDYLRRTSRICDIFFFPKDTFSLLITRQGTLITLY